jgi:hypothetical protein
MKFGKTFSGGLGKQGIRSGLHGQAFTLKSERHFGPAQDQIAVEKFEHRIEATNRMAPDASNSTVLRRARSLTPR